MGPGRGFGVSLDRSPYVLRAVRGFSYVFRVRLSASDFPAFAFFCSDLLAFAKIHKDLL